MENGILKNLIFQNLDILNKLSYSKLNVKKFTLENDPLIVENIEVKGTLSASNFNKITLHGNVDISGSFNIGNSDKTTNINNDLIVNSITNITSQTLNFEDKLIVNNKVNINDNLDISGNNDDGNIIINTHNDTTNIKAIHFIHQDSNNKTDASNCSISYEFDDISGIGIVLNGNLQVVGEKKQNGEFVVDSSGSLIYTGLNETPIYDIGIAGQVETDSKRVFNGLVFDKDNDKFKLFKDLSGNTISNNVSTVPNIGNIEFGNESLEYAHLQVGQLVLDKNNGNSKLDISGLLDISGNLLIKENVLIKSHNSQNELHDNNIFN